MASTSDRSPLDDLLHKRLVLVTGKGGVGRTTVTAALAHVAARQGRRVLVAELVEDGGVDSTLAHLFGRERLPAVATQVAPNIDGGVLLSRIGQELFLGSIIRVAPLARAALSSEPLRRLMQAGPALRELGIFYHLLHHLRSTRSDATPQYDFVVLDMPATGHTLALTGLPEILLQLVSRGPIRAVVTEIQAQLRNPETCGVYVVTIPEMLPVTETLELVEQLRTDGMPVGGVVVNRVPAVALDAEERAGISSILDQPNVWGVRTFRAEQEAQRAIHHVRTDSPAPVLTLTDQADHGPPLLKMLVDDILASWGQAPAGVGP